MKQVTLDQAQIKDPYTQDNFKTLEDYINQHPLFKGLFSFYEIAIPMGANFKFRHRLKFVPKDVIFLSCTNGATVTFNYDSFDNEFIDVTASALTRARFFLGRYEEI